MQGRIVSIRNAAYNRGNRLYGRKESDDSMITPELFLEEFTPALIQIRRSLHQIPELGTKERQTGARLLKYLSEWGIPCQYPVTDTGLVAVIQGKKEGKGNVVGLRADMDALPLSEDPNHPCCSLNPGVMHACGHDAHMAIALGTACYFKRIEQDFSGCVKIFFQPAEETEGGAERMVLEGCMEHPHVDYVTGLHMAPGYEVGEIEVKYGKLNAATNDIHIILHGESCHGAYPDTGVDAIVMAGAVITSLQSLVSRNISPLNQAVLTFGTIHGGTAHNIITDQVELTGTLRTTDQKTREYAQEIIRRQVEHIAAAYGGRGEVVMKPGYSALINSDEIVDVLVETAAQIIGKEHIHWKPSPSMGAEDFSFFLEKAPGVFYHLGCANKEAGITAPLHSRHFDLDENCLPLGVRLQIALTTALLER